MHSPISAASRGREKSLHAVADEALQANREGVEEKMGLKEGTEKMISTTVNEDIPSLG